VSAVGGAESVDGPGFLTMMKGGPVTVLTVDASTGGEPKIS